MKNKKILIIIFLVFILVGSFLVKKLNQNNFDHSPSANDHSSIAHYTCGMHPSVNVSVEEYNKGSVNCPICNMKLIPVYKEQNAQEDLVYYGCGMEGAEHVFFIKEGELKNCPICGMPLKKLTQKQAQDLKGVVSQVKIQGEQTRLAGVQTQPAQKRHLFKKIRTVGQVAFDPQLVVAQEEFISSLATLEKMQQGGIAEIKERADNSADSSRKKLRLLGLSDEQIKELETSRQLQTSLILPEEKMWIYGEVYEYEVNWVKQGTEVIVSASSVPGKEFKGVISSINPILNPKTRSVTFRAEVDNPGLNLKPQMYVDITIMSMYKGPDGEGMVLAIPMDAVLDTGTRRIVWVDKGNGEYEGRETQLGPEAVAQIEGGEAKFYPVIKGIAEGEMVVSKANFLIDSQSQISGTAASGYGGALDAQEKKAPPVHQH